MLESLFSSRVRAKLVAKFMLSPDEEYNAWQLADVLLENYSAVWKELNRLESIQVLAAEYKGRSKVYRVNPDCSILSELKSIVLKTEGIGAVLIERLSTMKSIVAAFIYGSYASGDADLQSDLDLLVIGEVSLQQFAPMISELETILTRAINYVILSKEDWDTKKSQKDDFISNLIRSPKVMLIGGEDAI